MSGATLPAVTMSGVALFVGSEEEGEALLRIAARTGGPWEVRTTTSPTAALASLADLGADVVLVSSTAVPPESLAQTLAAVSEHAPDVHRVVLAPGRPPALDPLATSWLPWPPTPAALSTILVRAASCHGVINEEAMNWFVQRIDTLPSAPLVFEELSAYLADANASAKGAAAIVERDVALSARVLRLANSPAVGLSRRLQRVGEAVVLVGLGTIRSLALSASAADMFGLASKAGIAVDRICEYGMYCALATRKVTKGQEFADDAFTGALLQDVGQLVMAQHLPEEIAALRKEAGSLGVCLHDLETLAWGFNHCDVGAQLLRHWNLAEPIIDAVAHHHDWDPTPGRFGALEAVALSRLLTQVSDEAADRLEPGAEERLRVWAEDLDRLDLVPEHILHPEDPIALEG